MQLMMLSQTIFLTYMDDMRHYRLNWHRLSTVYHPHSRQLNQCDMGSGLKRTVSNISESIIRALLALSAVIEKTVKRNGTIVRTVERI